MRALNAWSSHIHRRRHMTCPGPQWRSLEPRRHARATERWWRTLYELFEVIQHTYKYHINRDTASTTTSTKSASSVIQLHPSSASHGFSTLSN